MFRFLFRFRLRFKFRFRFRLRFGPVRSGLLRLGPDCKTFFFFR
jgi:hypothetical protein